MKAESEKRGMSMTKIVIEALELYLNSIFLAAHIEKDGEGKVTFSIREDDCRRIWIEDEDGRDNQEV